MTQAQSEPESIAYLSRITSDFRRGASHAAHVAVASPHCGQNLSPLREWPPPLKQIYCVNHLIEECLTYYLLEKKRIDERIQPDPKPARIQPRRQAKTIVEEKRETQEAKELKAKLEGLRKSRGLHLSLEDFRARLKAEIRAVANRVDPRQQRAGDGYVEAGTDSQAMFGQSSGQFKAFEHDMCLFDSTVSLECRFCGRPREAIAPVAPMHVITAGDIKNEQVTEFGRIKFATDACGSSIKIVLLEMEFIGADELDGLEKLVARAAKPSKPKKRPIIKPENLPGQLKGPARPTSITGTAAGVSEPEYQPRKRYRTAGTRAK